ncbi:MAG: sensor histidine kinase [Acidimicrobiales bacterium]
MIRELFRPWRSRQTWWGLVHVVVGLGVGTVTFPVIFSLLALSFGTILVPVTWPIAAVTLWAMFLAGRIIGQVERSRFAALLGVEMTDPVPPLAATTVWRRFLERFRVRPRWREIGYGLLMLPLGVVTSVAALAAWCGSAALVALPLYVRSLPGDTAHFWLFDLDLGLGAFAAAAVGVSGLALIAPWLTVLLVQLHTWVGRRLLAAAPRDEMRERVTQLETSRVAAVDSAEAERRRIERDLHDGAQQRLVSLAIGLGTARERLESDPDRGRELVAEAHEEAKAALKDLRDLVRGIHPVILEDRGLDPALSAIVARSPVPISLQVDVEPRPSPAIESTAYFVVSEALTNVARHAQAGAAQVTILRAGDRLVIEVRDDGVGGADPATGTGLAGLRNRVAGHGGTMHVVSPAGGPTTLLVEMPCES